MKETIHDQTTKKPSRRSAGVLLHPTSLPAMHGIGDLGPEGLVFIPAAKSPNGEPLLVTGNEVSGTTTVFQINIE